MKAKYSHEQVIDFFKARLPEFKKEVFERQRQTDNVVVWVAALSTGAIALILASSSNSPLINLSILKITVGFFLLTIISAVVFRAFVYTLERLESELAQGFEGYCYSATCEVFGPIKITETHTIEQIAKSLKEDMGRDYDSWLSHEYLDRDFWVDHYNKWAEFWKHTEEEGLRNLGRAFAPLAGKTPEETEEIFLKPQDNTKSVRKVILLRKTCYWSYNLIMIFFILAMVTVAIGFFIKQ